MYIIARSNKNISVLFCSNQPEYLLNLLVPRVHQIQLRSFDTKIPEYKKLRLYRVHFMLQVLPSGIHLLLPYQHRIGLSKN